jgi:Family of unknown function (DUF6011)
MMSKKNDLMVIFSGNATFTIKSEKSGKYYTIHIVKSKREEVFFVKVLAGDDNTNEPNYHVVGVVNLKSKFVKIVRNHNVNWFIERVVVKDWDIKRFKETGLSFLPASTCMKCGRKLTNPSSIENALGPKCAGRI